MSSSEVLCNVIPNAEISIDKGTVFNYPTHTHAHYEMTIYSPFAGGITVNGEFYDVPVSSAFLISPSDFHRITVSDEQCASEFIKIGFYEKTIADYKGILPNQPIILRSLEKHNVITELFHEIHRSNGDSGYVSVLIEAAVSYMIKYGTAIQPAILGKRHSLVVNVLRYANKNFSHDITLNNTAEYFSVSPQYLSYVFTEEVGMGFSAYITDLRLKRASELLNRSDMNITEICFDCGYRNLSHFLRCFKQHFGVTPKDYRKLNTSCVLGIDNKVK